MRLGKRRGLALAAVVLGMATMLGGCADANDICGSVFVCKVDTRPGSEGRLYMSSESPAQGEPVTFEVHRTPYPDPRRVSYLWSDHPGEEPPPPAVPPGLLGVPWAAGTETNSHSFSEAGVHWVLAFAQYATGHREVLFKEFIVRPASSSRQSLPTARLTVSPNPAQAGETVSLDASRSTASDGASITGYEWDLEGNGTYAPEGVGASTSYMYYEPGTYNVGVRVTDSTNQSATQTVPLQVIGGSGLSQTAAAPARAALGLPFSLRFGGRVTRVPKPTVSGRIVSTRGIGLSGRGRGGLGRGVRRKGRNVLVQGLMTGKWRLSLTSSTDRFTGTGAISGSALVVARGGRGAPRACVVVKAPVRRYRPQPASFTVAGGTGGAARLRASGRIAIPRVRRAASSPLKGRVIVHRGAQRSLPEGCGTSRYPRNAR